MNLDSLLKRKKGNPREAASPRKHKIRSGKQTITVTVPGKPDCAGIDPNHLLIDLTVD